MLPGQHIPLLDVKPIQSSSPNPTMSTPIPGYTLMVAGQRSGKTSFLRLLLDTSDISPFASKDQLSSVAKFVQGSVGHTSHIRSASIDIELPNEPGGHPQPIALTLIDTPSLDYKDEATAERLVLEMLRHVDSRFAEGLEEEWKPQIGDHHVHLCIYFLDPDVVLPPLVPGPPAPVVSRARTASLSQPEPEPVILEPPVTTNPLLCRPTLPVAEINTIRRLSARVNVLPVVARADTLTNDRLAAVKLAIRRDLAEAGIGFGIFDMDNHYQLPKEEQTSDGSNGNAAGSPPPRTPPPPPPTLNGFPFANGSAAGSPPSTSATPAHLLRLPYALISPEIYSHSDGVARVPPARHELVIQYTSSARHSPTPKFTRGQYIRTFRWGSVDVLAPEHSDFLPLRAAIFHHMDTLRKYTREYLYEKFKEEFYRQQHGLPHHLVNSANPPPGHVNPSVGSTNLAPNSNHNTRASAHLASMQGAQRPVLAIDTAPTPANSNRLPPISMQGGIGLPTGQGMGDVGRGGVIRGVHDNVQPMGKSVGGAKTSKQRTKKITVACNFCRSRKLKCDGGRPACSQCVKRSNPCDYMPQTKRRGNVPRRKNGDDSESESEGRSAEHDELPSNSALASASTSTLVSGTVSGVNSAAMSTGLSSLTSVSVSSEVPSQTLSRRGSNVDRAGKDAGFYGGDREYLGRGPPPPGIPETPASGSVPNQKASMSPIPHEPRPSLFKDNELPHIATLPLSLDGTPSMPMSAPTLTQIRPANEQQAALRKRAATIPGNKSRQPSSSGPKVVACNFCRARKTKCDGAHPACSSCARRSLACNYVHDGLSVNGGGQKKGGSRRASTAKSQDHSLGVMGSPRAHSLSPPDSSGQRLTYSANAGALSGEQIYGAHEDMSVSGGMDDQMETGNGVGGDEENRDGTVDLKRSSEELDGERPPKKMRVEGVAE